MACLEKTPTKFDECLDIKENASAPNQSEFEVLRSATVDALINKENTERKILALRHILEKDLKAADLKWSLFVAAVYTYRHDTCLRPFPPMYIKNETKDIESLRKAVELVPPLPIIVQELKEPNIYKTKANTIELLFWVLIRLKDLHIKSISKDCHESVLKRVNSQMAVAVPNLIFQIASAKSSASEDRWRELAKGHSTFYAYHGSRLENFHSIIHYGLQQHMCKKSLFGKGIYLSSELGVSLPYSPVGYGWGGSILGSDLSCIALCEIINHPDVKIGDTDDRTRNIAPESIGGKVPNKYCLVLNNDLVRIRYLLVYSQEFGRLRPSHNNGFLGWLKQHKLLTFMLSYVVLLASVGLSHNRNVERYVRSFIQKFGLD
ncbi:protein mono-ADP-ribosyltransferase PARP16 [Nasonia vitripennis]|uniref:Poly [ADP-ribose] polymerase n=1 Tax=Nasonia vitripennis TaxID=7425 RepID=A0A7M7T8N1_NASVI|nr:protein mono-ADP-ribosyltransferase PARP16 [Nasonia vitripennis]XP_031782738.1 protein mono-ADP-ribosyltransferase PARP16 [Nasonia vitripennis]XP_031782739.1 protein mono-ADP-ribosyltransferase PARP16 [Nasonia vitripennis]